MKDLFNRDVLGSILSKYKTLIAKSQVFTIVPWRKSEPVAQSNEGENDLPWNKKTKIR